MPNLTRKALKDLLEVSYQNGQSAGYEKGKAETLKGLHNNRFEALTKLYNSVGQTLDAVSHQVLSTEKYS